MLGEKLKQLRQKRNVRQATVAKILNITQQAYAKYEQNITEPDTTNLKKLADFFGVSIDYLLDREECSTQENLLTVFGFGGERKDFELNSEQIKLIEQLAEHMQKENDK